MTPLPIDAAQAREDSRRSYDLALETMRARMLAECRGRVPPRYDEVLAAFARMEKGL